MTSIKKLAAAILCAFAFQRSVHVKFRDIAFQFRMGAGFPGDVNRTHPAEIEAALIAVATPPTAYGQAVLLAAANAGVRPYAAADASDSTDSIPFGLTVRPFPTQQATGGMTSTIGAATPPTSGVINVARNALIMIQLNTGVAAAAKGGRVYVWCAATSGDHTQGGFETEASSGNTVRLDPRYTYNGPADSSGVTELSCNI